MAAVGRVELATVEVIAAMPRCRDCRWWVPFSRDEDYGPDYNEHRQGKGFCDLTSMSDGKPEYPDTKAWAEDGEDYKASLLTSPDFGCVQFQARD